MDEQACREIPVLPGDRDDPYGSPDPETDGDLEPLRIALLAPPFVRVPPPAYGGTERIVASLAEVLVARGHDVTVFASGDSEPAGRLVPVVPAALWAQGYAGDSREPLRNVARQALARASEFDVVHSHLDLAGLSLAASGVPLVTTFHLPLDRAPARRALLGTNGVRPDALGSLVAISRSQAATIPGASWRAVVYNGLPLQRMPFGDRPGDGICYIGRIDREKGVLDAIEVARLTGRRLRIAAKIGTRPEMRDFYERVFKPRLSRADVEYVGELGPEDRDRLLAESSASLMPSHWPEPFGLAAIESMAAGTPVLAYRAGALPEIVRHGVNGFLASHPRELALHLDGVAWLDRRRIREDVLDRFSAERMASGYEMVYRQVHRERAGIRWTPAPSEAAPV